MTAGLWCKRCTIDACFGTYALAARARNLRIIRTDATGDRR